MSVFARRCHVCNSTGRYTFQSVFGLAAVPEPLMAFACALMICRCRSSRKTSVACMYCSRQLVRSTKACPWVTLRNRLAASRKVFRRVLPLMCYAVFLSSSLFTQTSKACSTLLPQITHFFHFEGQHSPDNHFPCLGLLF